MSVVGLAVVELAIVGLAIVIYAIIDLAVVESAVVGLTAVGLAVIGLAVVGLAVVGLVRERHQPSVFPFLKCSAQMKNCQRCGIVPKGWRCSWWQWIGRRQWRG